MRRLAAVLAAFALLAACGDDGPDIDPERDEDIAEDALLRSRDLPDGFEEEDVDDDDDETNECNEDVLDIDPDELEEAKTASAGPVAFSRDGEIEVRAEIEVFADTELPQRVLDAIGDDDDYLDCLEESLADELPQGEVESVEEIDAAVDDGRAVRVVATIPTAGGEAGIEVQQHAVLVDRFGVTLVVTALEGTIDDDLVEDALEAMIDRIEDELDD